MTREEEIKLRALDSTSNFSKYLGFIAGAKWGDKTMIEKACRWLEHQEEMIGVSFEEDFIERFKRAMEE